jgi:syntaxin 16
MDAIVNERDQEIERIASSIEELAHVMKHLADLVIDQGTVLDRIDYNMDQAVDHVQEVRKKNNNQPQQVFFKKKAKDTHTYTHI